jgi:hypothetical protein
MISHLTRKSLTFAKSPVLLDAKFLVKRGGLQLYQTAFDS